MWERVCVWRGMIDSDMETDRGEGGVGAKGAWVGVDEMQDDEVDDMSQWMREGVMCGVWYEDV